MDEITDNDLRKQKNPKVKSFQEKYKALFLWSCFFGYYPPEMEIVVKNSCVLNLIHSYCIATCILLINMTMGKVVYLLFYKAPRSLVFYLARRIISTFPGMVKSIAYQMTPRSKKMCDLFHTWNNVINNDSQYKKREIMLAKKLRTTVIVFSVAFFLQVGCLQIPGVFLLYDRHIKGSYTAYVPHDPDKWYHFPLAWLQFHNFLFCNATMFCLNAIIIILLNMGITQLNILKENLSDIFSKINIDDEGNMYVLKNKGIKFISERLEVTPESYAMHVRDLRRELREWILMHQQTLRWLKDMKAQLEFTSTYKYLFIGSYICLTVFTLPNVVKYGRAVDIVIMSSFSMGSFISAFYETRLVEELRDKSSSLFDDIYDKAWFLYPIDVLKSLSIIDFFCKKWPIRIYAFKIFEDDSVTFLAIMNTAYKALQFLTQMAE